MNNDLDILLKLREEAWSMIRHYEEQRGTVTNFVIVMASVAIGFIVQQKMNLDALPIAILLIVLGAYGALAVAKLYERTQFTLTLAKYYTDRLNELYPTVGIELLHKKASSEHKGRFPIMSRLHMHSVWSALHTAIALVGVVLLIVIIAKV